MIIQWYRSWCYLPRQTYPYELFERARSYNLIDRSLPPAEELRGVLKPMDMTVFVEDGDNYSERVWVLQPFDVKNPEASRNVHRIGRTDEFTAADAKAAAQAIYQLTKE